MKKKKQKLPRVGTLLLLLRFNGLVLVSTKTSEKNNNVEPVEVE